MHQRHFKAFTQRYSVTVQILQTFSRSLHNSVKIGQNGSTHAIMEHRPITLLSLGYALKRFAYRMAGVKVTLETLNFNNLALQRLPVDPYVSDTQREVVGACFARISPTPVKQPALVCVSLPALKLLDIEEDQTKRPEFLEYFSGNKILPGSETAAHCYCGHQFGYFSGQLGDGAAIYLGEIVNQEGERWEVQLKGAGKTPFSRGSDGRKVLRSSIREFLCSEAMYHLGVPTTRAGSCITSETRVIRDIFYDGNAISEKCTLVLRISPTFLRFGSFEIFKSRDLDTGRSGPSVGQTDLLIKLLQYTIETFYPQIWSRYFSDPEKMYLKFYQEVVRRTARLVAHWQCIGWCHGVLNTDNLSIVGVTIDYGPFGFMDRYNPDFVCNSSDDAGRYSYRQQPEMCKWNCLKLAEAIQDVVPLSKTKDYHHLFDEEFQRFYNSLMRKKFGLKKEKPEDSLLFDEFLVTLQKTGADFTNCFRCLSNFPLPNSPDFEERKLETLNQLLSQSSTLAELREINKPPPPNSQLSLLMLMIQNKPHLVPIVKLRMPGLEAEYKKEAILQSLQNTTEEELTEANRGAWLAWMETYTQRLLFEESDVADVVMLGEERRQMMDSVNPRFILRNYVAQRAIDAAEKGDYSEVQKVLKQLESPYTDVSLVDELDTSSSVDHEMGGDHVTASITGARCLASYLTKPPAWASEIRVS
ncbi:protein adenylyltransferase SelO, mitochondrial-like [Physella acuta]|uniref:protein adenylyltransferase SelO, mitochondrial-like n=1 Tax=Physella acuta TaxID=109671 RepID=UPI0027DC5207|nr:protein adenylyltransferase SelO, mitochondrial-like [Physella acuta]